MVIVEDVVTLASVFIIFRPILYHCAETPLCIMQNIPAAPHTAFSIMIIEVNQHSVNKN